MEGEHEYNPVQQYYDIVQLVFIPIIKPHEGNRRWSIPFTDDFAH